MSVWYFVYNINNHKFYVLVSLVGAKDLISEYTTYVTAANSAKSQTKVKCHVRKTNRETVNKACLDSRKKEFVLSHVRLSENESIIDVSISITIVVKFSRTLTHI